jgi:hypothetical protein
MSNWTQPQCEACWIKANTTEVVVDGLDAISIRQPVRLNHTENPSIHQCAFCGELTIMGIFVRVDPTTVPFPQSEL